MSTHWVYDMTALSAMVADRDAAFLDPPADAFYSYPLGSPSPYGQQALALLSSLVDARGCGAQLACMPSCQSHACRHVRSFSPEAYAARNFEVFGAPSFAASGGYLDGSTKGFVRAVRSGASWPRCGVDDAQANCIVRLPPLVAAFAGDAALLPVVADMIRTTQDSATAVAWGAAAARVLEAVILGAPPAQAVQAAIAAMQARTPACSLLACHTTLLRLTTRHLCRTRRVRSARRRTRRWRPPWRRRRRWRARRTPTPSRSSAATATCRARCRALCMRWWRCARQRRA